MPAIHKLLERNAVSAEQITAWEYNEAFAVIDEIVARELGENCDRYNIYGGALAYGHPYGASGAIITLHLLQALRQLDVPEGMDGSERKYGIVAVSAAGGIGTAMLLEWNEEPAKRKKGEKKGDGMQDE